MTKRIICLICSVLLCLCSVSPIFADEQPPRLVDGAGLLSSDEFDSINRMLDTASEKLGFDIIIRTVLSAGSSNVIDAAEEIYECNGYGYGDDSDGVILLIDMEERECALLPVGFGRSAIDKDGEDYILDRVVPLVSDELYYDAFCKYVTLSQEFVVRAKEGDPYRYGNLPKDPYDPVSSILVSFVIALIIALIATGVMKGKLKSVHRQTRASRYIRDESMNVSNSRDLFLYRTITRVPRPKQSSSSGSRSSGGAGSSRNF